MSRAEIVPVPSIRTFFKSVMGVGRVRAGVAVAWKANTVGDETDLGD